MAWNVQKSNKKKLRAKNPPPPEKNPVPTYVYLMDHKHSGRILKRPISKDLNKVSSEAPICVPFIWHTSNPAANSWRSDLTRAEPLTKTTGNLVIAIVKCRGLNVISNSWNNMMILIDSKVKASITIFTFVEECSFFHLAYERVFHGLDQIFTFDQKILLKFLGVRAVRNI